MAQKQDVIEQTNTILQQRQPVSLASATNLQRVDEYDWATGTGRFMSAPVILLDHQMHTGRTGVRIYGIFLPYTTESTPLLLDLGWLPVSGDRQFPSITLPTGDVYVAGLLAPPPSPGILHTDPIAQSEGTLLTISLDISTLQSVIQLPYLAPRVLRLDPDAPFGYFRDLAVLTNTMKPNQHLGYSVQWFGLALTVLITALLLTFRKKLQFV